MKKITAICTTALLVLINVGLSAQEGTRTDVITITEEKEKTKVTIDGDDVIIVEEGKDTTRIKIGKRGIEIIEDKDGGTRVDIKKLKDDEVKKKGKGKFKGNWAGLEIGLNNFVNSDFSSSLDPSLMYMDLNTNRSVNLNINFLQYDLGLGKRAGIVTGMGFEFSNYFFDRDNNIMKNTDGQIVEYIPSFLTEPGSSMIKSKLATTFLTVPLLMEFHIPAGKRNIHLSGGVIGGAKIFTTTKIVYKERGDRQKDKVKDDFNINPLRYGYTARIGYRNLRLFANYYPVSIFEKGKGPELYPYSVGLCLLKF